MNQDKNTEPVIINNATTEQSVPQNSTPSNTLNNTETTVPTNNSNTNSPVSIPDATTNTVDVNLLNNNQSTVLNKAILFLLNGVGLATKNSFNIDYNEVMPNFTMLMNNYLYTSLENVNYNYKNAFRNFSLGHDLLPTYNVLKNDTNLGQNQALMNLASDAINNKSKAHIFCFLDNEEVIDQLVKIINVIRPTGTFPIFIHIVLRQKDEIAYDTIIQLIRKLIDKITLLQNVNIGLVVGELKLGSDETYKLITKENGQKWTDYTRKFNFVRVEESVPRNIDPFYMNSGFSVMPNDVALFLNYEDVDCSGIIDKITKVKLYTLFPMSSYTYAVNIYQEIKPTIYFSKLLVENKLKCLILTTPDRIKSINYSLNGLSDEKCPNITYMDIRTKNMDIEAIIKGDYNYVIFDYDISVFKEIKSIKEFLRSADLKINDIYNICDQMDYKFFITSLYGLYKDYIVGVDKQVKIDYSMELPAVLIDRNLPKNKFTFKYGDTFNLSTTIFNLLTNNENIPTSIRKKGILSFFID